MVLFTLLHIILQLWNQKRFGDFAPHARFAKSDYKPVKSTMDMRVPGEDVLRKGSHWTAEEIMGDFKAFVATAVHIADLLPGSALTE